MESGAHSPLGQRWRLYPDQPACDQANISKT
jgi:hypothetical protein